mmetsp:Transcript_13265/g.37840  ORF Transcript_13265/g.37840 Transcript_13265/m.37840 type:complete len:573 (+) Transcript_13265:308-2026(+)|eukprot:CAMPEP_0181027448 /NCGR_PEP_ID=MMETSP1070-20121207/4169_1 /TAXON_ID=265543 /ORGANISM="Minutocellus polymorphus, Strain NH13" /LENGTH=572 /DNA_ID=CAMNT_0023104689 /DNA_START=284 /DNA_END=2002 /DNA_ORIENTATION=-
MSTKAAKASRYMYRALSSVVENSIFCEGDGHSSIRFGQGLTAVVPTKAVQESLRGFREEDLLKDEEQGAGKFDPKSSSYGQLPQRDWTSFVVVYTMIFFNGCCFTAVVPSVPFYLEILGAAPSFLGWVVSFYSLGQFVGSPTAGWLADRLSSKRMLTMSSTLGFFSSVLYAVAPNHWFVLISRVLTGVSAGIEFTTELAYIARNTTEKERTTFLASVTAVNVVGFILGPALTTALSTLDFTIFGLAVNQYTGPGWLLVLMFLVDIVMVQTLFRDSAYETKNNSSVDVAGGGEEAKKLLNGKNRSEGKNGYGGVAKGDNTSEQKKNFKDHPSSSSAADEDAPPPPRMVASLIFVQFTAMCSWSVLETITSPVAYSEFGWDVRECNLLFTFGGFMSLLAYFGFVVASKWVQDRCLIVCALVVCFVGLVLLIDWPQLWFAPGWMSLPPYVHRFVVGYSILNMGFMTARPVCFALYSKLIAPQHQSKCLGWMVAGGSAARMAGPFVAVYLYYGIADPPGLNMLALFGTEALFQLVCTGLVVALWSELLPIIHISKKKEEMETATTHSGPGIEMEED